VQVNYNAIFDNSIFCSYNANIDNSIPANINLDNSIFCLNIRANNLYLPLQISSLIYHLMIILLFYERTLSIRKYGYNILTMLLLIISFSV